MKKKNTAGRTVGLLCASVRRKSSSSSSYQGVLSWQADSPSDDMATGANGSPPELLAHRCFLCFTRGGLGGTATYECLRARQICQRVQRESQPASIRALNHDSVYADRLTDKLLRCNTQYSSKKNSLLWSYWNKSSHCRHIYTVNTVPSKPGLNAESEWWLRLTMCPPQ